MSVLSVSKENILLVLQKYVDDPDTIHVCKSWSTAKNKTKFSDLIDDVLFGIWLENGDKKMNMSGMTNASILLCNDLTGVERKKFEDKVEHFEDFFYF